MTKRTIGIIGMMGLGAALAAALAPQGRDVFDEPIRKPRNREKFRYSRDNGPVIDTTKQSKRSKRRNKHK